MKILLIIWMLILATAAPRFTGTYEYKSSEESENHFIVLEKIDGVVKGEYYGSEDGKGHGIFFYKTTMENLKIADHGAIEFEIGDRFLYETTRLNKKEPYSDSSVGRTRYVLKYVGRIADERIKLVCSSEDDECWAAELTFERISNGR